MGKVKGAGVSGSSSRGRRAAGSGTREAIAAAARQQFAEHGYRRTSLRAIAAQAGVDPRLVLHFYGSKQALFVAVVDLPFEPAQVFERLLGSGEPGVGRRLAEFVLSVLGDPDSNPVLTGMVRAAASEQDAAHMIRETVTGRLLMPLARHVGRDHPELRAALVAAQIVGLVMARHIVGVDPLARASGAQLVDAIAPVFEHYLTGDLTAPRAAPADQICNRADSNGR